MLAVFPKDAWIPMEVLTSVFRGPVNPGERTPYYVGDVIPELQKVSLITVCLSQLFVCLNCLPSTACPQLFVLKLTLKCYATGESYQAAGVRGLHPHPRAAPRLHQDRPHHGGERVARVRWHEDLERSPPFRAAVI